MKSFPGSASQHLLLPDNPQKRQSHKARQGAGITTGRRTEQLAAVPAAHLKGPEERCEGADVHGVACDGQQVVHDARDLREQDPDVLPGQAGNAATGSHIGNSRYNIQTGTRSQGRQASAAIAIVHPVLAAGKMYSTDRSGWTHTKLQARSKTHTAAGDLRMLKQARCHACAICCAAIATKPAQDLTTILEIHLHPLVRHRNPNTHKQAITASPKVHYHQNLQVHLAMP